MHHLSRQARRLPRVAYYHHKPDISPFTKITQGINTVTSTLLKTPVLSKLTQPRVESLPFTNQAKDWTEAVKEAQGLVNKNRDRILDPAKLVGQDLWELKGNITQLLGSGHPFIDTISRAYFESDTFRIRPLLVLLIAKSLGSISSKQERLAEITEMIYTATLLHNDVLENTGIGNKMAVLAGDFLLARASLALAQLRNPECTELIATCITNSVEGVFMQLQAETKNNCTDEAWTYYMKQVYMDKASLIAQSCKASAVLSGCSTDVSNSIYEYGKHLGIAFHCKSDVIQFSKMAANTSRSMPEAWINAPVLLAWKEYPELGEIIKRQFSKDGDMEAARLLVYQSSALKKTLELVDNHMEKALKSLESLPASEAKSALVQLTRNVQSKQD